MSHTCMDGSPWVLNNCNTLVLVKIIEFNYILGDKCYWNDLFISGDVVGQGKKILFRDNKNLNNHPTRDL